MPIEDSKAKHYIKLYERESEKDNNFKTNLWQPTADLILPRMNQITTKTQQGSNKEEEIFNTTGMLAAEDMTSGLSGMMIPQGQLFYKVDVPDAHGMQDKTLQYLDFLTERSHELLFDTNFVTQFNEALLSMIVFGPCNLFSEFDINDNNMNYLNFDVGTYTIVRDSRMRVVAVMVM